MNRLYYGDNLDVLRRHIEDESVDLVYLDPPFNSNASYNVLFAERDGTQAAAQIKAFEDTWRWDESAARAYEETVESGGKVSQAMQAFRTLLGESDMMAYLAMMAPRLVELRRVLKSSGTLYLHCDATASHYLKMLLDAVFGPQQFRNELIWKRTSAHSSAKRFAPVHDTILFYAKTHTHVWNPAYQPLPQETADAWYNNVEPETARRFNRGGPHSAGRAVGTIRGHVARNRSDCEGSTLGNSGLRRGSRERVRHAASSGCSRCRGPVVLAEARGWNTDAEAVLG
jgi:adenine specific DNA methylase Mod